MGRLINLTPHPITILNKDGEIIRTIPIFGIVPRVTEEVTQIGIIDNIPIMKKNFGQVENLPEKEKGTFLIVSSLVASACPDRDDLLVPNTVRDEETGQIIGCDSFSTITSKCPCDRLHKPV